MSTSFKPKKRGKRGLRRPFHPGVLKRARELARRYQIIVWQEDDRWFGRGLEMPFTFGDGPNAQQAIADCREGLITTVASMLEQGEVPPPAATRTASSRNQQVTVRLSPEEKLRLDAVARQTGYKKAGDYLRARALAG